MLKYLPGQVRGCISLLLYLLNTIVLSTTLLIIAAFKFFIPVGIWRKRCDTVINWIAGSWIAINNWIIRLTNPARWDVQGIDALNKKGWYMVVANHQSWLDILVLQRVFHGKIPFLKFFLKKELIWVPFLGLAWWALDFPFMKRYTKSFLKKHPHLKGMDLKITQKACEKFKTMPVSVMNFLEGTRFTPEKHRRQQSPFVHLLKPKAGGIAFVLAAMGEQMHQMLDVTIAYPDGVKNFWQFLCGNVKEIRVRAESLPIDPKLVGDYFTDKKFRITFQNHLNVMWEEKDALLASLMYQPVASQVPASEAQNAEGPGVCREMNPDMLHS
ncbi:MAG: acyltransferase [Deltaproteobacteria bacterium]|nr:acyltransferase [Deltaproteobacteria bacterium]